MVEGTEQSNRLFHRELVGELRLLQLHPESLPQFAVMAAPGEAENLHISRIRFEQTLENFDRGRLACAVGTEQTETFAASDLERQTIDSHDIAVSLDQIAAHHAGHDPGHSVVQDSKCKMQTSIVTVASCSSDRARRCRGLLASRSDPCLRFEFWLLNSDLH